MENIKYYVLGQKNNKMLHSYLDKYFELIKSKLLLLINKDDYNNIISTINYRDFLLSGDISSLINRLTIIGEPQDGEYKELIVKLEHEISLFVSGNKKDNINLQGKHIGDTNIRLTTKDYNPYNAFDAHPQHRSTGGIMGWGEKTQQEWLDIYNKTFNLLKEVDEGFYDELNTIINKIIPLGTSRHLHNSASYKECIGHLYMGFTLDIDQPELSNIEAIIHESSHNKLNLLFHFDPLILNTLEENYYSPFRPDARHLRGIFLAIHAFVPTIYVLMNAYKKGLIKQGYWLEKIVLYYIKNKITYKVLAKYAKFSELGNEIMDEVLYVMKLTDNVFRDLNVSKEILNQAIIKEKQHFNDVNINYPNFKY